MDFFDHIFFQYVACICFCSAACSIDLIRNCVDCSFVDVKQGNFIAFFR